MVLNEVAFLVQVFGIVVSLMVLMASLILSLRGKFLYPSLDAWLEKTDARLLSVFLVFVGVVFRASTLGMLTETDEAGYIMMSKVVYEGKMPYHDFFTVHPPAYFLVTAFVFKYFGVGVIQAKILPLVFSVGTMLLLYHTAREFYGPKEGLISLFVASISLGLIILTRSALMYSECVFFSTLSAYLFIKAQKKPNGHILFSAGLSAGIATMYRLFGLYVLLAMLVHLFLEKRRVICSSILLISGFLLITAPFMYFFGAPAVRDIIIYNAVERPTSTLVQRFMGLIYHSRYMSLPPIVFGLLGAYALWRRKEIGATERFLMLWVVVVFAGTMTMNHILPWLYASYFVLASPPLAVLGGNAVKVKDPFLVTLVIVLSFMAMVYNVSYVLRDISFHTQQSLVAEYLRTSTPAELQVTGSSPYAQAIAFLSGRQMLRGVVGLDVYLSISSNGVDEFIGELGRQPVAVVLNADDVNPDMRLIRRAVEGTCRIYKKYDDIDVYLCNTP